MITRRQSISNFFQIQGAGGLRRPVLAGAGWYWLLSPLTAWICKIIKNALSSGYHGTSNFDHQTLIRSDLNYTNAQWSVCCVTKPRQKKTASTIFFHFIATAAAMYRILTSKWKLSKEFQASLLWRWRKNCLNEKPRPNFDTPELHLPNVFIFFFMFFASLRFVNTYIYFRNMTAMQSRTGPVQGQNRDFPVYFSHTGKNLFTLAGIPVMKTGLQSLWLEILSYIRDSSTTVKKNVPGF